MTQKALLLDAAYVDENSRSIITLYVEQKGKHFWLKDKNFYPYLYVLSEKKEAKKISEQIMKMSFGQSNADKAHLVEETGIEVNGKEAIKVLFARVSALVEARKVLSELGIEKREYDVPYAKRYLLDKRLEPGNWVEYEEEGEEDSFSTGGEEEDAAKLLGKAKIITNIKAIEGEFVGKATAFDLETKFGQKFAIGAEPILMVSVVAGDINQKKTKSRVTSYGTEKVKGLEILAGEKEIISELEKELNEENSFIITYNGDNFDFSYTKERAKKLKIDFLTNGTQPKTIRKGLDNATKLNGIQHIDAYQIMKLMQRTGAVSTVKLDIETVSEKVFGVPKEKVFPKEINEAWETGDRKKLERLVDYNLKDSETAFRIAQEFLPLFVEISKLTSQTLFETTRNSTSQMVEDLLMKEAHARKMIAPNKPKENEVTDRTNNPIKGAFVKEPIAGLHENIAVLDFASLYPSIIISHNISPDVLNCEHKECKEKNASPDGTWFCLKEKGLVPEILEKMLKQRLVLKAEYKKKKKAGTDDRVLFAKQWALKIVLNSVYGYLGYPRARWYSRECASAVTALARHYIQQTIAKAEKAGFEVVYGDTDSNFLKMLDKSRADVEKFVEKINSELPETMELELDGFYKRGIFVTKKEGGAAKKRYALMDEKGNLKIVGFEYVRRDWCNIAKETQKRVIELVLSEGEPVQAIAFVKKVLKEIKEGKVKKSELAIMTMLQRLPKDYTAIGPHVAAAEKAIARGKELGVGSMLSFIITKPRKGKESISDKAELEEFVEEGNYDADYYIENQVLPAVIKIMQELGYTKEDLISGGKQTGLSAWG